jgi:YHS domain-containing protein
MKNTLSMTRRLVAGVFGFTLAFAAAAADRMPVNLEKNGLALQGYDPVAYFSENKPVKGQAEITATHNGATYRFASKDNKAAFESSPDRYEPAFGGYCGYGVSVNKLAPIDPTAFQLIDGRLVLQYDHDTLEHFNKDQAGNLKKAEMNWPGLVKKNSK